MSCVAYMYMYNMQYNVMYDVYWWQCLLPTVEVLY